MEKAGSLPLKTEKGGFCMNHAAKALGARRSAIREIFEYGSRKKKEWGEDAIFDLSLGNPSVPPPPEVQASLLSLLNTADPTALHGYTTAAGDMEVRRAIADYSEKTLGVPADPSLLYLTVGAAAALSASLGALLTPADEAIVISPYFPEYRVFIEHTGAKVVEVPAKEPDFTPDMEALGAAINERTAVLLLNSPNNPTGVVLSEKELTALGALLRQKEETYAHPIYLLSDEPYRELVYDGLSAPSPAAYYDDTLVCYSFSKSLSLPGERIGYVAVHPRAADARDVYLAIMGAARALGYVCAPSLFQHMIPACLGKTADIRVYDRNRRRLYEALTSFGFRVVRPGGAFYLFLLSPEPDAGAFAEKAKARGLLFVPGDSFGCPGYVRVAYCVSEETITRCLPVFAALAEEYGLKKK